MKLFYLHRIKHLRHCEHIANAIEIYRDKIRKAHKFILARYCSLAKKWVEVNLISEFFRTLTGVGTDASASGILFQAGVAVEFGE